MKLYEPRTKTGLFFLILLNFLLCYLPLALLCLVVCAIIGGAFAWLTGGSILIGALALSLPVTLVVYGYIVRRDTKEEYETLTSGFPEVRMTIWRQTLPCFPKDSKKKQRDDSNTKS